MKILRQDQPDFESAICRASAASSMFDPAIEQAARDVIEQVRLMGDAAVIGLTEKFDGVKLTPSQLVVTEPAPKPSPDLQKAFVMARRNVSAFARHSLQRNWQMHNRQGAAVGEKFDPFDRVGVYIPGGMAPLVSTSLMTIVLAKEAGCRQIVVCTPPNKQYPTLMNPDLLYAVRAAGATELYLAGGAHAIAAMAFGTSTIPRVRKIFGPGNAYVVAAKRLLFGYVAVDLLPGPSELLVLADDTAEPRFVAADMLAQAEHGSGHERVWLVTTSERVLNATQDEIGKLMAELNRTDMIQRVLDAHTVLVLARDVDQAVAITNQFAPEHLEIMTDDPRTLAKKITTAGAIFLGPWSPTVVGDYIAGPSHVLPTGGAGALFAGLTVDQFQRRTSLIEYTKSALRKSIPSLNTFASVEGLDAHGLSARIRFRRGFSGNSPS